MRMVVRTAAVSKASGTSRRARWVVTRTTRRVSPIIIIRTGTSPQRCASNSVWPLTWMPAAIRLALQIGAVTQRVGGAGAHQPQRFDDGGVRGASAGQGGMAWAALAGRQGRDLADGDRAAGQGVAGLPGGEAHRRAPQAGGFAVGAEVADQDRLERRRAGRATRGRRG